MAAAGAALSESVGARLRQVATLPADDLAAWDRMPRAQQAPDALVWRTVEQTCMQASAEGAPQACRALGVVSAVLAHGSPQATRQAADCLSHLEQAYDVLAAHLAKELLLPREPEAGDSHQESTLKSASQLPLLLLAQCFGAERLTPHELLSLARGDMATAVAMVVMSLGECPWRVACAGPQLSGFQAHLWRMLRQLSAPHCAAELAADGEAAAGYGAKDVSMSELLDQHAAHAHRLALCLVQFDALGTIGSCADNARQRGLLINECLHVLHNLVAAPQLTASGRLVARHLAVRWPSFGMRHLAPHLRRLLGLAGAGGGTTEAQRELRQHLRTLSWASYHCSGLRAAARPVCAELALRALRSACPMETLAVAVTAAANAGALGAGGPLESALRRAGTAVRAALAEQLRRESQGLWLAQEARAEADALDLWPVAPLQQVCAEGVQQIVDGVRCMAALGDGHADSGSLFFWEGPYLSSPDEFWEGWESSDDEDGGEAQAGSGTELASPGPLGPLDAALLTPRPPLRPRGGAALPLPTVLLCLAPAAFRCSLDGRLCRDPVQAQGGQQLFERASILEWLKWHRLCPISGAPLDSADLIEAVAIRTAISEWLAREGCGRMQ